MNVLIRLLLTGWVTMFSAMAEAGESGPMGSSVERTRNEVIYRDLVFAEVDDLPLKLDLYLPQKATGKSRLVVFFHGGSWRSGSKESCQVRWLVRHGYGVASVGYRKSYSAPFPVILHDCKGAVRFLRANADRLGVVADKIAVAGASAGGHLALLLATTAGVDGLEGAVGGNLQQSSRVQLALGLYCPTDLRHDVATDPGRWNKPSSPLYLLLGGKPSEKIGLALQASVTTHVTEDDPPIILLAGGADKPGPVEHGRRLKAAYERVGLEAVFQIVPGAGHGGPEFRDEQRAALILSQLEKALGSVSDNS